MPSVDAFVDGLGGLIIGLAAAIAGGIAHARSSPTAIATLIICGVVLSPFFIVATLTLCFGLACCVPIAVAGIVIARFMPHALSMGHGAHAVPETAPAHAAARGAVKRFAIVTAAFLVALIGPSALAVAVFGAEPFVDVLKLFTTAAFVTFGGAYAVLPFVADAGVNTYGWLTGDDMLNGLALAETTPGPLILVTTYVGFFAGWNADGLFAGIIAALLTTYVTFLPSFYLIIAGAPYVESIQRFAWARNALSAITAAVVGVILSLAIFLGRAALFESGEVHWVGVAVALISLALLVTNKLGIPMLVALGAAFGLVTAFI